MRPQHAKTSLSAGVAFIAYFLTFSALAQESQEKEAAALVSLTAPEMELDRARMERDPVWGLKNILGETPATALNDEEFLQKYEKEFRDYKALFAQRTKLHQRIRDFKEDVKLPSPGNCSGLLEGDERSHALYSLLFAALQNPAMRAQLQSMIVKQDNEFVYYKFPSPKISTRLQKSVDKLMVANKRIYKVKKAIHTGPLLPSKDPWVNTLSKALYEYATEAQVSFDKTFTLMQPLEHPDKRRFFIHLLFGTPVETLRNGLFPRELRFDDDGKIIIRLKQKSPAASEHTERQIDASTSVVLIPGHDHFLAGHYDEDMGGWILFDPSDTQHPESCGKGGPGEDQLNTATEEALNGAPGIVYIISAPPPPNKN